MLAAQCPSLTSFEALKTVSHFLVVVVILYATIFKMSNSTASYRQLKEDFVSNLTGGPVGEIAAVTAVLPVSQLAFL